MSIIDSLSAGYRLLGKHLYLVLVPVALDLFLWVSSRLAISTLMADVVAIYEDLAALDGLPDDMIVMVNQASELLEGIGQETNLLNMLVSSSLLHMPSMLVSLSPLPNAVNTEVATWWQAGAYSLVFGIIGILIGVFYMNLLAQALPLGDGPKVGGWGEFLALVLRHWGRLLLFILLIGFLLLAILTPIMFGVSFVMLLIPALGSLLMVLASGFIFVVLFYLFFVVPGIIVDDLSIRGAIAQSVLLVRNNFWATIGFLFVTSLISTGFYFVLSPLAVYVPMGTLAAIIANAFIGSGLTMALLIFYRTRRLRMAGLPIDEA